MQEEQVHLLVVDDDADIRQLLADYLRRHGFVVSTAENGTELFAAMALPRPPDLVVLDVMLPGEDGLSLCKRLREERPVPVIFLTALDSVTDRVVGLEIGADDYMVKPFEPRELLARIRTVLRRATDICSADGRLADSRAAAGPAETPAPSERLVDMEGSASAPPASPPDRAGSGPYLCFDGWRLHTLSRELRDAAGVLVNLSDAQYRMLMIFLEQPFQVLSRDLLLTRLHGREAEPFDRSIDIQVSRLRTRLRDSAEARLIRTVRGGGYMLCAEVRKEGA